MTPSEFHPGYSEASHDELRPNTPLLVSYGLVIVRAILAPDARGWPGVSVGRGGRCDEIRQHPGATWLIKTCHSAGKAVA